jgi:hypothetical protein
VNGRIMHERVAVDDASDSLANNCRRVAERIHKASCVISTASRQIDAEGLLRMNRDRAASVGFSLTLRYRSAFGLGGALAAWEECA